MRRVGWDFGVTQPGEVFDERGSLQWHYILASAARAGVAAPRTVLDFGCGVGRILRPAVRSNPEVAFWGCDVHASSIRWLEGDLAGRAHVFVNGELPPLPVPDAHFELIYAFSVFTHLVDSWSAWLVELHRVLSADGVALLTVAGPGHSSLADEPIDDEHVGMNVLAPSASWDVGGPLVLHSEWWLRAHWGRAFDIVALDTGDPSGRPPLFGQSLVILRKRPVTPTIEALESPEPGEDRELSALRANILSLRREVARHAVILDTRSWKMTAPLRAAMNSLRVRRAQLGRHVRERLR
jgi:SAM-dependent methyltransferase